MDFKFSSEEELRNFLHKKLDDNDGNIRRYWDGDFTRWLENLYWRGNTITVNGVDYDFIACIKCFKEPLRALLLKESGHSDQIEDESVLWWMGGKKTKGASDGTEEN